MGTQLPTLTAAGTVVLESIEQFHEWWDQWPARGALAVVPSRDLAALEQLDVTIQGVGIAPVVVRVEVVRLDPQRTMLRLLAGPVAKPALPEPPAMAAVEEIPPIVVLPPPAAAAVEEIPPIVVGPPLGAAVEELPPIIFVPPPLPFHEAAPPRSAPSRTQDIDASGLMPDPNAEPLGRYATPGPQVLDATARAMLSQAAALPLTAPFGEPEPARPAAESAPIVLEPLTTAPVVPVVIAEPERPRIVLEPVAPEPVAPPVAAAPSAVTPPPAAAPATAADAAPSPESAPAPPPARAALPPYFTGDALRFGSEEDLAGNRQHLESVGALLAVADGALPLKPIEVRLIVGARETTARVKVTLSGAAPGTAVVQATERGGFLPLLRELDGNAARATSRVPLGAIDPSATSRIPAAAFLGVDAASGGAAHDVQTTPRAFSLPRQGTVKNPATPQEILALPMARSPTDKELERPSVPLLLRWIRSTRGVLKLEVTADEHPVYTAIFVDGREVRTPASLATLAKSLSLPSMTYQIVDLGRAPDLTTKGRTLHLIGEVIRALSARIDVEELERAFPVKDGKCVRAVQHVVDSLGFPPQHNRFIKADLDGTEFIEEVARAAVGARTVWETLYNLAVFDGIGWDDPPEGKTPGSRSASSTVRGLSVAAVEAAADEWAAIEGKDHFQLLGLHWSCAPSEVGPAYQRARSDYGVGGMKRPTNAATAEKISKRIEEAYRTLSDTNQRRAYRREKYNLVWPHQAQLLVAKAKLEVYRKNYQDAKNILDAAEDLSPTEEAKTLLAALTQAQRKKD